MKDKLKKTHRKQQLSRIYSSRGRKMLINKNEFQSHKKCYLINYLFIFVMKESAVFIAGHQARSSG